jgi:nitrate reductase NapE component
MSIQKQPSRPVKTARNRRPNNLFIEIVSVSILTIAFGAVVAGFAMVGWMLAGGLIAIVRMMFKIVIGAYG